MKITITLNLNVEANPQSLPATLHEPEVHPMDGSIKVTDYDGNVVGLCEFDEEEDDS